MSRTHPSEKEALKKRPLITLGFLHNTLYYGMMLMTVMLVVRVVVVFVRLQDVVVDLVKSEIPMASSTLTSFCNSCLEAVREVWSMLSKALLMLRAHTCSPSWRQRAVTFPRWRENLRRVLSSDSLGNKNTRWVPSRPENADKVERLKRASHS